MRRKCKYVGVLLLLIIIYYFIELFYFEKRLSDFIETDFVTLESGKTLQNYPVAKLQFGDSENNASWVSYSCSLAPFRLISKNAILVKFRDGETHVFISYVLFDIGRSIPGMLGMHWIETVTGGAMIYLQSYSTVYVDGVPYTIETTLKDQNITKDVFLNIIEKSFRKSDFNNILFSSRDILSSY